MATKHLGTHELASFLRGVPAVQQRVIRHLLSGCAQCQVALQAARQTLDSDSSLDVGPSTPPGDRRYEAALNRAEQGLALFLSGSRPTEEPPDVLLNEIAVRSLEAEAAPGPVAAHVPLFIKWLIQRSEALRFRSPEQMFHFALLARLAADACAAAEARSTARLADLRARALGQLGNAFRVAGKLDEAEATLDGAQEYCAHGTGDPLLRGQLLQKAGVVCIYRRKLDEALDWLSDAGLIFNRLEALDDLAATHIHKAIAYVYRGNPEKAIELLDRALLLIDGDEDPLLLIAARHNYVRCLIDLGQIEQAIALSERLREQRESHKIPILELRHLWHDGKILQLLSRPEAALRTLQAVQRGFHGLGLAYEAAVVGLEVEPLLRELGRREEADRVFRKASETLQRLQVPALLRPMPTS
jgi:tetratricopeptide (TPR) repeat protein